MDYRIDKYAVVYNTYTHTYTHTPIPCYTMHTFIIFIYVLLGQPACGDDLHIYCKQTSKDEFLQIKILLFFFVGVQLL